jgi:putative ABC transport system permease protein
MLKSYILIAFRNLRKQKMFSLINIFGLTTGLAAFLLIALYIFDELTYDRFHTRKDAIYRVIEHRRNAEGQEKNIVAVAANVSEAAKKDLPEVADATRFSMMGRANIYNDENTAVFYESLYLADASFTRIFDFPVLFGDEINSLKDPHTVILTEQTAQKVFGQTDVVGKTLRMDRDSTPYKITAVVQVPDNSHLQFNMLFSEASLNSAEDFIRFRNSDWSSNTFVTYLLLKNSTKEQTGQKITELVRRNRQGAQAGVSSFYLQPLTDIHFYSDGLEGQMGKTGNIAHVYVFGLVALFVLFIACINYMNLTTARFSSRSKEIAVRKVAGASQKNLVKQFLTEASLMTAIALLLALVIVALVLPSFNAFTEKELSLGRGADYRVWLIVLSTAFIMGLLSGIYPAFFQSRLKPYLLLKNKLAIGKGHLSLRRVLVVFQFALSIVMIVATLVVYQQMKYIDQKDLGFNKEQLLVIDINSGQVRRSAETVKAELAKLPAVKSVSVSSRVPGEWKVMPKVQVKGPSNKATKGEDVYYMAIDEQFLQTFQVNLHKGRNFSGTNRGDSTNVLINESAAKLLGITEPAGQVVEVPSVAFSGNASPLEEPFRARVIGIVKDFNYQSLREKVAPMILAYQANPVHSIDYFTARVETANAAATLKSIEAVLEKIDESHLFEYNFLDKQWDLFYREDQKRQVIFFSVAALTIFIACLGLFGLATYAAEQRIKEIGIRKVLGASVNNIVGLLSTDFLKLVGIAALIAFPVAWWAMNKWLEDFEYRIAISWTTFLLAAGIAIIIALLTISFRTVKAALTNPVKNLRTE